MTSTLERHMVTIGGLRVGHGPAVVIGGRVSLRPHRGQVDAREALRERATLVEPYSAADLPTIAALADAVVVGATWTRVHQPVAALGALDDLPGDRQPLVPVAVEQRRGS
ncbi:chorismate mutase, partial [Nonomuraea sp. NPDC001684]